MIYRLTIPEGLAGKRLDDGIATLLPELSKGEVRRIIDRGGCAINASMVRVASRQVRSGDILELGVMEPGRFQDLVLPPEAILLETADWIGVSKPPGINSQRTPYQLKGTMEYWIGDRMRGQGVQEPVRIAHRLDRGTSGAMIFPKTRAAAAWVSHCFKEGMVDKQYLALIDGCPKTASWNCSKPIGKTGPARYGVVAGGKPAATEFRVLCASNHFSLVEAIPLTGRTHQIRVHLADEGLPIVGDSTYGGSPASRMMLHCSRLSFRDKQGTPIEIIAQPESQFIAFCLANGLSLNR